MAKNLLLIHGAWSGPNSFNYLSDKLQSAANRVTYFRYDVLKDNIATVVQQARTFMKADSGKTVVVGHSLGGLIALALHDMDQCDQIITMASPLAGIKVPSLFQSFLYSRAPILEQVAPHSRFIRETHKRDYSKKVHCVITRVGFNPAILEPSDGVVTIDSQESWLPSTGTRSHTDCNHYEILQSQAVVPIISAALR